MERNQNQPEVNSTFKHEMQKSRVEGEIFTQKKSAIVAMATVGKLKDAGGNYITLTEHHKNVMRAVFYPTNEVRMNVIKSTLNEAGLELDDTTEALLTKLLNPAGIQKALEALEQPAKKTLRDFLA